MSIKKTTFPQKEMEIEVSCEMEDLTIYSHEVVKTEFLKFLEKTSGICENQEILVRIGQNLRMKFNDWPNKEQALDLFTKNMYQKNVQIQDLMIEDDQLNGVTQIKNYFIGLQCATIYIKVFRIVDPLRVERNIENGDRAQCPLMPIEMGIKIQNTSIRSALDRRGGLLIVTGSRVSTVICQRIQKVGKRKQMVLIGKRNIQEIEQQDFQATKIMQGTLDQQAQPLYFKVSDSIISDPWNKQQEIDLLKTILMKGKRWSELSILYGRVRTENSLKNKYNSLLKKEKMKYELETINPVLFEKVQQLRKDYANKYGSITSIEEIDNYEWQFIVLAIQSLYIELCTQEGRLEEAQKIKKDDFFDLFHQEQTESSLQQSVLYKKSLNIQKIDSQFQFNNDKCGIVIFNQKNKKIYITPYNALDFKSLIIHPIAKRVKQEEHDSFTQSTDRISFNPSQSGTQSIQQLLYLASQAPYYIPLGQSMFNSYWLPPQLASQSVNNQIYFKGENKIQQNLNKDHCQGLKQEIDDMFDDLGVDIKRVDSDDEK